MTAFAAHLYARAFRSALREHKASEDDLVRNFSGLLQKQGALRRRDKILRKVSQEIVHYHGGRWVMVETARELSPGLQEKIRDAFSNKDYMEQRIRPELIAGVRIVVDGSQEFDGSLKRKLDKMFS